MFAKKNYMSSKIKLHLAFILSMCFYTCVKAIPLPTSNPIYIELICSEKTKWRDNVGLSYYIWHTDIYTKEKKMIHPKSSKNGHVVFELDVYNPTYNIINTNLSTTIPFYVEPYDSLIIEIDPDGTPLMYRNANGSIYAYENMLRHDISSKKLYTSQDYVNDRDNSTFKIFTEKLTTKMNHAIDSINHIASLYKFSEKERDIAVCNAKMQYMLWMFEFTTFRSHMLQEYASKHTTGWQNLEVDDQETDNIRNPENYSCISSLITNDKCLSSQYLDIFINDYENSEILKHDQYLYFGDTSRDSARMDSALCARDIQISGTDQPSALIKIINDRRHLELPTDMGIVLKETKVISQYDFTNDDKRFKLTEREIDDLKSFQAPVGFNILGLAAYGINQLFKLFGKSKGNVKQTTGNKLLDYFNKEDEMEEKIKNGLR